ncbi:hypothetical protein [Cupriavidus sp. 8B]
MTAKNTPPATAPSYTLRDIRTFVGYDGYGLEADVYLAKRKVASIYDAADGSPLRIEYAGGKQKTALHKFAARWYTESGVEADHEAIRAEVLAKHGKVTNCRPDAQGKLESWVNAEIDRIPPRLWNPSRSARCQPGKPASDGVC